MQTGVFCHSVVILIVREVVQLGVEVSTIEDRRGRALDQHVSHQVGKCIDPVHIPLRFTVMIGECAVIVGQCLLYLSLAHLVKLTGIRAGDFIHAGQEGEGEVVSLRFVVQ
jgi:hypothetical protein